jgi:hypothetical protein
MVFKGYATQGRRRVRRVRRVGSWFFYLGDWVVLDCGYAAPGVGRFVGSVGVS